MASIIINNSPNINSGKTIDSGCGNKISQDNNMIKIIVNGKVVYESKK